MLHERGVDTIAYDLDPPDASTLANAFAFRPFATVRRADGASLFAADRSFEPRIDAAERDELHAHWERRVALVREAGL